MKPSALRNLNWAEVQTHLSEDLQRVHAAWLAHGPGTTRQVAERSGISLLTFRPRTTDLYQLGLVECIGQADGTTSGVYRHVTAEEAGAGWDRKRRALPVEVRSRGEGVRHKPGTLAWAASIMAQARATKGRRSEEPAQLGLFV